VLAAGSPDLPRELPKTPEAQAAIDKALVEIGCKVEADDGYKADDVEGKDGEFEVIFDKDFNITSKEILGPSGGPFRESGAGPRR